MQYSKKCECCGHEVVAYTHKLNKSLVSALRKLVDFYEINRRKANVDKDLDLTYNQQSNFQKLRYFKLVYRDSGGRIPTQKWVNFIYGSSPCENTSATLGKSILYPDHEARQTHKHPIKMLYIHDVDETQYKRKEDYAQEKPSQTQKWFFSFLQD